MPQMYVRKRKMQLFTLCSLFSSPSACNSRFIMPMCPSLKLPPSLDGKIAGITDRISRLKPSLDEDILYHNNCETFRIWCSTVSGTVLLNNVSWSGRDITNTFIFSADAVPRDSSPASPSWMTLRWSDRDNVIIHGAKESPSCKYPEM